MVRSGLFLAALVACGSAIASPVPSNGVISAPGSYTLAGPRTAYSGTVISINANDVDLDLGGQLVRCAPANPGSAVTIGVSVSGSHVTVRNGAITGCYAGVSGYGDYGVISDVDFTGNTYMGANLNGFGIQIRGSVFQQIGGYNLEAYAVGINGLGTGCRVEQNIFRNIYRQAGVPQSLVGEGVAILLSSSGQDCVIRGNWIANGSPGANIAIWLASLTSAYIAENTIVNFSEAIRGDPDQSAVIGNILQMRVPFAGSYAIAGAGFAAANNTIIGFASALTSGTADAGGNVIHQ